MTHVKRRLTLPLREFLITDDEMMTDDNLKLAKCETTEHGVKKL